MLTDAGAADTEQLIEWMRELWLTDTAPFNESLSRQALAQLLADPTLGRAWLLPGCAGYLILTFGFSLEYGGRDAFIDEFFIAAPHRGRGLGRRCSRRWFAWRPGWVFAPFTWKWPTATRARKRCTSAGVFTGTIAG